LTEACFPTIIRKRYLIMAPLRLFIAIGWTFLLTAFLSLFLSACASGGASRQQAHRTSGGQVLADEEGAPWPVGEYGPAAAGQGGGERDKARQKRFARKKADKSTLPENGNGGAGGFSLYRGDGDDENLASILTADYLKQFDIPIVLNDAVHYFVRYFTTEKRKVFGHWLKRSRRYVPMIREILREHGLPEDLIYLAMIESGFNPKAYSSMKASGPWQFIYETGGRYGLRVNHWVDERRDPEKSTVAAALYLKDLFNQFGSWHLAAAAYNAGEGRIERSVQMHQTADYWELTKYNTLPRETREYIPRLLAAALIAKSPEKFGFTDIVYDQPVTYVSERAPGGAPLAMLAEIASTDAETIKALNPEILTNVTPPDIDEYTIRLPETVNRRQFRERLGAILGGEKRVQEATIYIVKKHESLSGIMERHNVSYNDLLLVNASSRDLKAKTGAVLYIPRFYRVQQPTYVARETGQEDAEEQAEARSPVTEARPPVTKGIVQMASFVPEGRTGLHAVTKKKAARVELKGRRRVELKGQSAKSGKIARTSAHHSLSKGQGKNKVRVAKETGRHKKRKVRTATSRVPAGRG